MPELLYNFDLWLFKILNGQFINPFFDKLFPFITLQANWNLLYILLSGWILWKGGKKGRIAIIVLAVTIAVSDQLSSNVIKPLIERPRPCHFLTDIRILIDCGPGFSFPSSHAVNNFAAALILSYFYRENRYFFFVIAALIAYSRVYVGVHFPIDIVSGAIIGIVVATFILLGYKYISYKFKVLKVGS